MQKIDAARCNVCGDLLAGDEARFGDARCEVCSAEPPAFERAVSYGVYEGVLRQLIHLLKYERIQAAAAPLARLTAAACLQLEGDIDVPELVMIPVPAHKARLRSRGFNQAELIARGALCGIEEATGRRVTLEPAALLRVRFADSQVALTAEERREQIRGAFKVIARERVKGREILLVDDVLTTGATASECARELMQAGAQRVWVATPARALGRSRQDGSRRAVSRIDAPRIETSLNVLSPTPVNRSESRAGGGSESDVAFGSSFILSDKSQAAPGGLLRRRGRPGTQGGQPVGCPRAG